LWLSSTANINVRLTTAGSGHGTGTVTYSSSSGAQTITLGGRQVSFTAGASDTATAITAVDALMNDPLISLAFPWSNAAGVVTMTRIIGGTGANATLAVTGTGATRSGANLTGGTDTSAGTTTSNGIIVPANIPFPLYKVAGDHCIDAIG